MRDIDTLIASFYSVFDNREGRQPSIGDVTRAFHERGVIAKQVESRFEVMTPAEFARPRVELLAGGALADFHEWETSAQMHGDGAMALRISRYEKSGVMDGAPFNGTGRKLFQLVREDGEWRILSLVWSDD